MVERVIIDIANTQIHGRLLPRRGTGTSIKSGGVTLVLLTQIFPLSEMMGGKSHFIYVLYLSIIVFLCCSFDY